MLGVDRYLELMQNDKKVEGGKLRLVLLQQVGRAAVTDAAPLAEICRAIADRVWRVPACEISSCQRPTPLSIGCQNDEIISVPWNITWNMS